MVPNIFNLVKYTPAVYGERDLMTVRGSCRWSCGLSFPQIRAPSERREAALLTWGALDELWKPQPVARMSPKSLCGCPDRSGTGLANRRRSSARLTSTTVV